MAHMYSQRPPHSTESFLARLIVVSFTMTMVLLSSLYAEACRSNPDRVSFDWALVEDADPLANGMMLVMYGDRDQGIVTHVSLHRILRVLPGIESDLPAEEASRLTALITDGTLGPLTYIIFREPFYYGADLDELGLPRRLWQDAEEDGINGNETLVTHVELTLDEIAYNK
ncbi:MAG: hypothetical protein ACREJU_05415 [Nitrospiraceae bacterium]